MEGRLVFKQAALVRSDGTCELDRAVIFDGAALLAQGPDADVPLLPGDWEVACGGRALVPCRVEQASQLALAHRALGDHRSVARLCVLEALLRGAAAIVPDGAGALEVAIADEARALGLHDREAGLTDGTAVVLDAWPVAGLAADRREVLLRHARAAWVVVKGQVLVREGVLLGLELASAAQAAAAAAAWNPAPAR